MTQYSVMPIVSESNDPSPSTSSPTEASTAAETEPTSDATMNGNRFGNTSLMMIIGVGMPDSRAMSMYDRSRADKTWARMTRAGNSQARAATTRVICTMDN